MMTSTQLSNQEPYLIIHADGKITASEKMQPSETAARVLECMKTQWMEDSQSKQIRELQERIKRLEEALEGTIKCFVDLADSGDAGFWNPDEQSVIIAARAALESKEAKP